MEVRVKNLTKQFGKTTAVNHIDVVFKDGKLTGLLGPSGCGKSTTLYMIAGLEGVTDGEIMFGDRDVTTLMPEKRNIGLVFQNYALYPHMTVRDNITFPLSNIKDPETGRPYSRAKRNAATDEIAKLVQIESLLDRKPGQLSGGQQQRVAIARALVKKPDVLLLDEPLSNLDARLRMEMRSEIRRIQQESKVTTIFVTHDQEEAMSITDEIVLMRQGVVQQVAGAHEMYMDPANSFVASFMGNPPVRRLTMLKDKVRKDPGVAKKRRYQLVEMSDGTLRVRSGWAYAYILPAMALLLLFTVYPLVMVLRTAFYQKYIYITNTGKGFGLSSFAWVLKDSTFWMACKNTAILLLIALPITLILALGIALLINSIKRLQGLFQTIYFLPYVTSTIAIGMAFLWLFHSDYGYINYFLQLFGMLDCSFLWSPPSRGAWIEINNC